MEEKYRRIKEIVEKELSCSAHNMEHVMRVYNLCLHLAKGKKDIDLDVLKTATLLHDIAKVREDLDDSGNTDHAVLGAKIAERILMDFGYPEEEIKKIRHCIITHRFRGGNEPKTREAKILFDADKLDILGSTGIARTYMFAGQHGQKIYLGVPVDEYIKGNLVGCKRNGRIKRTSEHAPNLEFETKIRHIPERLYTRRGKEIARQRLEIMERFFERLKKEINGET
jgi:uncharacterized protein